MLGEKGSGRGGDTTAIVTRFCCIICCPLIAPPQHVAPSASLASPPRRFGFLRICCNRDCIGARCIKVVALGGEYLTLQEKAREFQ
jgi:hypothetical protein